MDIIKHARNVEKESYEIQAEVQAAYNEGRLTKVERDGDTFYIEDPETGSGLCMSVIPAENKEANTYVNHKYYPASVVANDICFARRVEW